MVLAGGTLWCAFLSPGAPENTAGARVYRIVPLPTSRRLPAGRQEPGITK